MMPGVVCLPHGFGHGRAGTRMARANEVEGISYNDLSDPSALDVASGNAALNGLAVEVCYAGSFVARSGRSPTRPNGDIGAYDSVIFHPSETLLYRLDGFDEIDRWLAGWLGDAYRPELDAKVSAWPAAIERPAIRVSTSLTMALAEARMAQLLKVSNGTAGRRLILTCDSYSLRALRDVASPDVAVMDLLDFAFGEGRKGGTGV